MSKTQRDNELAAKIIIAGVGGAGNNAINRMYDENIQGVKLIGFNTDKQALNLCKVEKTMQLGAISTKGLGAGAKPEVGEKAAEENVEEIKEMIKDADMVFVTCGMGGGTGTGASPVIARVAKELGILTVGVVTKPFRFESKVRAKNAKLGINNLSQYVDTLIVVPNDKLLEIVDKKTTMPEALKKADEVLNQCVQGITNLINVPSLINLDFADVQTVMKNKGIAHIGMGTGTGENKAVDAAKMAISSPLLETSASGATDVIVNVSGDISLFDVNEAVSYIQEITGDDTNIIFGSTYDDSKPDELNITFIATGIKNKNNIENIKVEDAPIKNIDTNVEEIIKESIKDIVHNETEKAGVVNRYHEIQIPTFLQRR